MGCTHPALGTLPRPLSRGICVLICLASFSGAFRVNAQDVAEAARQEKARKAAQGKPKSKVYTDEDLKKPHILTSEDRARVEAAKKEPALSPNQPPAQSADAVNESSQESLGEIARRYRREKEARSAQQATKTQSPSLFKLDLPKASLAAPVAPRVAPVIPLALHSVPERSEARAVPARRNPFSRAVPPAASRGSILAAAPTNAVPPKSLPVVSNSAPRSKPIVSPSARTAVTIQSGDSLWKLARQYLGRGSRWQELLAVNPGLPDPRRIQPGSVLVIPQASAGVRTKSPPNVLVQRGDSLWKIAEAQFGRGSQWACLAQANPQLRDFNHIEPGQTITIPANCGVAP